MIHSLMIFFCLLLGTIWCQTSGDGQQNPGFPTNVPNVPGTQNQGQQPQNPGQQPQNPGQQPQFPGIGQIPFIGSIPGLGQQNTGQQPQFPGIGQIPFIGSIPGLGQPGSNPFTSFITQGQEGFSGLQKTFEPPFIAKLRQLVGTSGEPYFSPFVTSFLQRE